MSKLRIVLFVAIVFVCTAAQSAFAIPAFARMYGTSCSTCHIDFPKLNDFGKAFKDAGFKFPKDDDSFVKIPPVMLGAPAQKEIWPKAIWPGTIPGLPPIGLRFNTFFQVTPKNASNYNSQLAPGTPSPTIPRTDLEPGFLSMFMAGNFGDDIAFWVDTDFNVGGSNAAGGLGDGYLKFVNIGRFLKLPKDALSMRIGQFELDLPFSPARSWNVSGWDIFDQTNVGVQNPLFPQSQQQNVNNAFALSGGTQGIEFSGGHHYGGYQYSIAIVNQNTGGPTASPANVSAPIGYVSDSNFKDLYGRVSYRFNLERDAASRNEIQATSATGPRDHTSITLGSFGFYGRSVQRFSGVLADGTTPTVLTAREPFYRLGGDLSFNYRNLNLLGTYIYGHDKNLVPFIPVTATNPTGFIAGSPAHYSGGFIEADYMIEPWVMGIMRWDSVSSGADRINGIGADAGNPPATSFFSPYHTTRQRFTPGVQFLIHANIKTSFEYQIRPEQIVYLPGTNTRLTNPFRTNTAVVALEWVY